MSNVAPSLRLVLVAHRFGRNDGQGRVNFEVALAALKEGHAVTLLAAYCAEEIASHPNARFVRIGSEKRPTQLLRNLAFANQSSQWIKKHRNEFDLVQANGFVTWEKCDVVTAHFVHSSWSKSPYYPFSRPRRPYAMYQRLFTALNARWERGAYLGARHVIAVSEIVCRDLQQLGVPEERIETIYNGVDVDEFAPGESNREAFHLPAEAPLALFVGDIRSPRKNLDTLLRAMRKVPGMHLAVAGDTKGSPAQEAARQLQIDDRVHFVGKTNRIAELMRSVDMFVFPSRYEAHPLVVLEAMASGLPIILSKSVGSVGAFGELVDVLDDPDDADTLAKLMGGLIASPERRRSMGAKARARALDLSWSKTTRAYLRTYESMAHVMAHIKAHVKAPV